MENSGIDQYSCSLETIGYSEEGRLHFKNARSARETHEQWAARAVDLGPKWAKGHIPIDCDSGPLRGADAPSGWTCGSFGIWCKLGTLNIRISTPKGEPVFEFSSLTHVLTGLRIAVFDTVQNAARAAEIAEPRLDWKRVTSRGIPSELHKDAKKIYELWKMAGLATGPFRFEGAPIWLSADINPGQQRVLN